MIFHIISNYINDAFWGLWFSLGNASAAFPYAYEGGKAKFESDFCVIEYAMGREKDGESHKRKRKKVLPQVTNVSQFWRLIQPGVSRCRKEQTGEPLVERTYHPVRVPMGAAQQKSSKIPGHVADWQHVLTDQTSAASCVGGAPSFLRSP